MRRLLMPALLIALAAIPSPVRAQVLGFQMVGATSIGSGVRCDRSSIQFSSAGNDMSLTFSQMNASMPAGENIRVKSIWGSCLVSLKTIVPQGYTVSALQSSLLGGVLKDIGTSGYVDLVTTLTQRRPIPMNPYAPIIPFGPMIHFQRHFPLNEHIDEPLFELSKSTPVSPSVKRSICAQTAQKSADLGMYVRLSIGASRQKTSQTNIINIDTVDGHLDLTMNIEACPKR